jgi:hypothetical protein
MMKTGTIILLMLALTVPAYAQNEAGATVPAAEEKGLISIPPGHVLYEVMIAVEDIQELLTLDPVRKVLLKQKHLNQRVRELEEDAVKKKTRNAVLILKKLQMKRMEIDEALEGLKPKCADVVTGEITPCMEFDRNSTKKTIYMAVKRQNTDVLTRLVESDKMPEQSKEGLRNAIEKSGLKITEQIVTDTGDVVQANMTQSYKSTAISYVPFKSAMVYVKGTDKWYSVVISANSATVSDEVSLTNPDYYIYPTQSQMNELMRIANSVNAKKKLSWQDSAAIVKLWIDMPKKKG